MTFFPFRQRPGFPLLGPVTRSQPNDLLSECPKLPAFPREVYLAGHFRRATIHNAEKKTAASWVSGPRGHEGTRGGTPGIDRSEIPATLRAYLIVLSFAFAIWACSVLGYFLTRFSRTIRASILSPSSRNASPCFRVASGTLLLSGYFLMTSS